MSSVETWGAPASWDYEESVEKVRPMVTSWRTLTVEIVEELYRAREELDSRGRNRGAQNVPNGTFSQYLDDVGLAKSTVHRWLERYVPEERKLLSIEEVEEQKRAAEQRKRAEERSRMDAATAATKKAIEYERTGHKPPDWDEGAEKIYQKRKAEEAERDARIERLKRETQEAAERREREQKEREAHSERIQVETEMLRRAADEIEKRAAAKQAFKDRIRLSQSGANNQFIEALMEYLEELPDDNRRLEACNDIIKVVRGIAVQLHEQSARGA